MIEPPASYKNFVALGVKKGHTTVPQIVLIGILAGWYIGFGMLLVLTCGMDTPDLAKGNLGLTKMLAGLYGLPFGLFMTVMTSSDLCTSNFAMVPMAWFEGKITWRQALRSMCVSWGANFLGSLFLAWLVSASHSVPHHAVIVKVTTTKAHLPFHVAVAKGVLCNWLVCTAVALSCSTDSVIGKFVCILAPVSIFVSEGFEHCVANMFALPFGIFMGAEYSVHRMLVHNILPVTLGNFLGAAGPVGLMMWLGFGSRHGKPLPTWCPSSEWPAVPVPKKGMSVLSVRHRGQAANGDALAVTTHSDV